MSEKANHPRLPSSWPWRNTSDILRSRVSPWWRFPCVSVQPYFALFHRICLCDTWMPLLRGSSRCFPGLVASSHASPLRKQPEMTALPTVLPINPNGLRPSNHGTSIPPWCSVTVPTRYVIIQVSSACSLIACATRSNLRTHLTVVTAQTVLM